MWLANTYLNMEAKTFIIYTLALERFPLQRICHLIYLHQWHLFWQMCPGIFMCPAILVLRKSLFIKSITTHTHTHKDTKQFHSLISCSSIILPPAQVNHFWCAGARMCICVNVSVCLSVCFLSRKGNTGKGQRLNFLNLFSAQPSFQINLELILSICSH